jgi:uncharacterized protein
MKESYYNNYIENESSCLIYNSYSDSYLLLNNELYNLFNKYRKKIDRIKENNKRLYQLLLDNGMIVDDEINEIELYINERIKRRFSSTHYDLMINPTLDCNLNCWYCYEEHIHGSKMSNTIIARVIRHIEKKYKYTPFKSLTVSFFGGEPLLKTKSVINPLIEWIINFTNNNNIILNFGFTTNGTIIKDDFLSLIKNTHTNFQITIDGDKTTHNKIRGFKNNNSDSNSYDIIIANIKKIVDNLKKYKITLRINYDAKTLKNAHKIIDDLKFIPNSKFNFNLEKVWQEDIENIDSNELKLLSERIKNDGFSVDVYELNRNDYICYADNYNQALINYDGNVFKCTARDFTKENAEGYLNDEGDIIWYSEKLTKRLYSEIPKLCKECKLLPSCPGVCTQTIVENEIDNDFCFIKDKGLTFEEFIFSNFENRFNNEN